MPFEPRVFAPAPTQVLLNDAMHRGGITTCQLKRRAEHDVLSMVKHRVIVAEFHILRANLLSLPFLAEDLAASENFGDEHRAFALGSRREEMEILPDRSANRAWDACVVFES